MKKSAEKDVNIPHIGKVNTRPNNIGYTRSDFECSLLSNVSLK